MLIDQRSYRRKERLQSSMRIPRTGIVQQWTANGRQFHLHGENEKQSLLTDLDRLVKADPLHDWRIEGRIAIVERINRAKISKPLQSYC